MAYYDLSGLKEMAQGNDDFVKNMINVFLEHTPPIVQEMNESFSQGNLKKVGDLAHQIKPSIDLMGIEMLHKDIRDIESKGKMETIDGLDVKLRQLNFVLKEVFVTMEKEL